MLKNFLMKLVGWFSFSGNKNPEPEPDLSYVQVAREHFDFLIKSYNYYSGFGSYSIRSAKGTLFNSEFETIGDLYQTGSSLITCMTNSIEGQQTNRKMLKSIPKCIIEEQSITLATFMVTKDKVYFVYPSEMTMTMICDMTKSLIENLETLHSISKEGKYAFYLNMTRSVIETSLNFMEALKNNYES